MGRADVVPATGRSSYVYLMVGRLPMNKKKIVRSIAEEKKEE